MCRSHINATSAVFLLMLGAGCSPLLFPTRTSVTPPETFTPAGMASATPMPTDIVTSTPEPFALQLTPLATPTALATLELPTQSTLTLGIQMWDGLPTYPAESRPDFYFRVLYDPATWALTMDRFGYPVLANRTLAGCVLGSAVGRGLPLSGSVEHEVRRIGAVTFQVSKASVNGVARFINYTGGDGVIYTAFEASFQDQTDLCVAAAEGVLGTLRSVPLAEATPMTN
jgi:hypothetical protein